MTTRVLLVIIMAASGAVLTSCTDAIILMTGNKPSEIREGCKTLEPGTELHPLANLVLVMSDRITESPDSLFDSKRWLVKAITPRVRLKTDTLIASFDHHKIPVRIYNNQRESRRGNQEVILFLHGGGFVWGDIKIYDNLCSKLAKKTGAVVISLEYRLAPEFTYPYALRDSESVLRWTYANIEKYGGSPSCITLMGDSAGGNMAAVMSLMSRTNDNGIPPIKSQVLIYPVTILTDSITPSRYYFLTGADRSLIPGDNFFQYAREAYLTESDNPKDPLISPHFAESHESLPDALIITAGCDPLRDEGRGYAELLEKAGNYVDYREYDGMIHGFVSLYHLFKEGRDALDVIEEFINESR
ncbi:MAG: alpha/beta hydrolase [Bacteroidales bacterium]|nr:alpha/beta hydrolase [Bacteroidales bacterium]